MNYLARVKRSKDYDLIVESLYNQFEDPETGSITIEPITNEEGTTALLLTDGTSWEYVNEQWQRIDEALDQLILYSLNPFIMQICDSIHNHFIRCEKTQKIKEGLLAYDTEDKNKVIVTGFEEKPFAQTGDFIYIETELQTLLSRVLDKTDNQLVYDDKGLCTRITGENEKIYVHFVMFPPQFLDVVLDMLGYDLFKREGHQVRTERLGNYTYTNFEPAAYYGIGTYPQELEDNIKYWQHVYT